MKECSIGKKISGFVTAEILIAFVVISLALTGTIVVVFGNESLAGDAIFFRETEHHILDFLSASSTQSRVHFDSLESFSTTTNTQDLYEQSLFVTDITRCSKKVRNTFVWGVRKIFHVSTLDYFSSDNQEKFSDSCVWSGLEDWHTLHSGGVFSFPTGALMTGLDVFNKKLFVSASSTGGATFFALDVSSSTRPTLLSSFIIGANVNALDVAGNFAYLAVHASSEQFQVVDISDPVHPTLIATRTLPGVAGVRPQGVSIFYFDSKVYIGTKRTAGHEFHIYDVSQPTNPVWQGSIEMNHNVNAISVENDLAYLATSGNTADLMILDVSLPSVPKNVASLDLPGSQDGKSLYLLGNRLYLGRFRSTHSYEPEFYILDIHHPTTTIPIIGSLYVHADINSVYTTGNFSFLATGDTSQEFKTISIASSTFPTLISPASLNLPTTLTGLDYERGFLYGSLNGNDGIRIFSSP